MKNPVALVAKSDIHDYVRALWKTEALRQSHVPGGYVYELVEQFAALPRLFCEATNDYLERAHFCTWWGAMMHRDDYANPTIKDLYHLHEIAHAATMPYIPGIGFEAFHRKMEDNELKASVTSEIRVYFELPGLRVSSFAYPIYADRFLDDPEMRLLWDNNRSVAVETLQEMRRDVMFSKPEHDMDLPERWIRKYAMQNRQWSIVWHERAQEIERHMHDFQIAALGGDRAMAMTRHRDWLEREAGADSEHNIPFRQEAELFARIYWSNRRKYDTAFAAERGGAA
jgi:hypothetical protein